MHELFTKIKGGIIVSCQAAPEDPTYGSAFIKAFALSAFRGGAVGLRVDGKSDIEAIREVIDIPIIGIKKQPSLDQYQHIITPSAEDAIMLEKCGVDLIALDVTNRPRANHLGPTELIKRVKQKVTTPLMGDCHTFQDAVRAKQCGIDCVATTLTLPKTEDDVYKPDLQLLKQMVDNLSIPVIAEGRFWDFADVEKAFELGAWAVVIGSAITRPWEITKRYVKASKKSSNQIDQ